MASKGNWTVIFEDKLIINQTFGKGRGYIINDDNFWSQAKFSNIWAIQYGTSVTSDEVEYRDTTPHSSFADANIGDISQFTNKWDEMHLMQIQWEWDEDNVEGETESEKITRLGARPTSYSS